MKFEKNIFRLSAILYADQNYNISTKSIIKKIIESVYIETNESNLSIDDIINYCETNYSLQFDYEEIKNIVSDEKDNSFMTYSSNDGDLISQLNESRRQIILSKISANSIDVFIEEYSRKKSEDNNILKDLVYRFLYYTINNNQSSFIRLLNTSDKIELPGISTDTNFSLEERKLINDFLNWDSDGKNKALFDILSFSVEYCLLVSDNRESVQLSMLKNKKFYLDTNIIYRIIGINGIERKKRTETFLKKCVEIGIELYISKYTDTEFNESIKNNIIKMKQFGGKRVDSTIFYQYANNYDIYDFYYHWREKRVDANFIAYQNYIFSLYESFKKHYKIPIDYKIPYDLKDKKHQDIVKSYAEEIRQQKDSNDTGSENDACYIDAENIYLIEQRRNNNDNNLSATKYFIISTDQSLRKWDYQRTISTPVVIHPSQWLSIILRYVSRTLDDYKSFVSFLNIKAIDTYRDNHTLHIIISAISETTEDLKQQKELVNVIVESQFKNIINGNPSDDEIFRRTVDVAQQELDKKLDTLTSKYSELAVKMDDAEEKISSLSELSSNKSDEITNLSTDNIELKNELKAKYINSELKKWKKPAYFLILPTIILLFFYFLQIFFSSWEFNYSYKLIRSIDALESDGVKYLLYSINYGSLTLFYFLFKFFYKRLLSKDASTAYINNLEIPSKYK